MKRAIKYIAIFVLGFLMAKFWCQKNEKQLHQEEINVVVNGIKNISKLVVSEGAFSEVYNYSDAKKYFFDYLSFNKRAIITVNAKVEVGYDLSKLDIEIDSINRKIIIHKIPTEEVVIAPNVKYFDLQQSSFNSFTKEELNKINQKSIDKIEETIEVTSLKKEAKNRLFEELSKIYQLSSTFNWEVEDKTDTKFLENTMQLKH